MKDTIMHALEDDETRRFFEFAASLPDRDFWGRKGRYLRGDFERFQEFLNYVKSFELECFLVAKENSRFVGFVVAVFNPTWINELKERYGCDVEKRAYILGIAVVQKRKDILTALVNEIGNYFSQKKINGAEYPTLGDVCLTTGTDILTSENVDALIMFREAGFRISECYYSMKLDLDSYEHNREYTKEERKFRLKERRIELIEKNEAVGEISWEPIDNRKTSIDLHVTRAHRGKGIGTALMAEALQKLKTDGVKTVELGVDGNNLPALKLYRKFGFTAYKTHFYIFVPFRHLTSVL